MPAFDLINHLIDGNALDFSSIQISVGPKIYTNVSKLQYTESIERGYLRGTSPKKKARTRGQYEASGSMDMYKEDHEDFLTMLASLIPGRGYMEVPFVTTMTYTEHGRPSITNTLDGCYLDENDEDHSEGSDPLFVSVKFDISTIRRHGGIVAIGTPLSGIPGLPGIPGL